MAELILYVDENFGGAHIHLTTTTTDFTKLSVLGVHEPSSTSWNDQVSSFKIISGTWAFYRDINFGRPFLDAFGTVMTLSSTSEGTPNPLNQGFSTPGEFPVLPVGIDNDALSSVVNAEDQVESERDVATKATLTGGDR